MKTRTTALLAVLILCNAFQVCHAMTVRDFEGIPDDYLYFGGGQNLGNYYPDLNFGPDVTVLDRVRYGYNDADYPPHSGDAVIFSGYEVDYTRVDFVGFTATYAEAWYTSASTLYMEAYDAGDNLVDSSSGPSNLRTSSLISVSGADIAYVKIHDEGNYFGLDDFGYVPEPATMILLGLGSLIAIRRRCSK